MRTGIRRVFGTRWFLTVPAVIVAVATAVLITVSLGSIRTSGFFDRAIRRIEMLDRRGDYGSEYRQELRNAAEFARNHDDWIRLLRSAWRLPVPERWRTVQDLAATAAGSAPSENTWRIIGSYAALRAGDAEAARSLVLPVETSDHHEAETVEFLFLLAALEAPADELEERTRHGMPSGGTRIVDAVFTALDHPDAETHWRAWEKTAVPAFALNSALHAAREGNREDARRGFEAVTDQFEVSTGVGSGRQASLYIATWLGESDRVYRQLRHLADREEAVTWEMLLLQADINLRQSQYDEARRIFQELREVHPDLDPLPFLNDAILTERMGDGDVEAILEEGLRYHPDSEELRFLRTTRLVRAGRREEALNSLQEILESLEEVTDSSTASTGTRIHDYRLLERVLRARIDFGRGAPPERLESDLWKYLNRYPEAHQMATFLARLSALRRDRAALSQLTSRYSPQEGAWAATLHLIDRVERNLLAEAEEVLPFLVAREDDVRNWTGRYNRALFALRFLPLSESRRTIAALRTWLERSAVLPPEMELEARVALLLLEAEQARIEGDGSRAVSTIDNAIDLNPDNESLYSYRTLLAPRE